MHRTCRHRPRCRRRLARCGRQGTRDIRPNFNGGKTLCYPNAERKLQITPNDWVLFDVPLLLTLRDKMWVRAISRALVEQFKRSSYTEMPYCKNFLSPYSDGDYRKQALLHSNVIGEQGTRYGSQPGDSAEKAR